MSLISVDDILDDTLRNNVKPMDLDYSDEAYYDLCNSLGAYRSQLITEPLPIDSKRFLMFWISCEVCTRLLGTNLIPSAAGGNTDWYKTKLDAYKEQLAESRAKLTYNIVTGITSEVDDTSSSAGLLERA